MPLRYHVPVPVTLAQLPTRPRMPTDADEHRSKHQWVRLSILRDEHDDTLSEFMEQSVDGERLQTWGIPDISANPLADSSRQLTTPGLYGRRPKVLHSKPSNAGLIGPGGWLDRAGYWTRMQSTQYLTVGMGDWLLHMGVMRGELVVRSISPHDIWLRCPNEAPDRPVELWELMLREHVATGEWIYTYDAYDLGDPSTGRPASYRIVRANADGDGKYEDLSNVFLERPDGSHGPVEGPAYPWRRSSDDQPRFPFTRYRSIDSGECWNAHEKRGAHRGTLNAGVFATYAGHCARDATGSMVMIAGLEPVSVDVHSEPSSSLRTTATRNIRSVRNTPGMLLYHELQDGVQPFIKEIGPGVNLEMVAKFAAGYEMRQQVRAGLSASDAAKKSANPTSGSALHISNKQKREFSDKVEPLFRASDLDAIELAAIVLRAAGLDTFDEDGYSVVYAEIPRSPQEEKERRDGLQWQVDQGLMSEAQRYQELNPGATLEDAVTALAEVEVMNARVRELTERRLAEEGLTPPAPPPAPPDPPAPPSADAPNTPPEADASEDNPE